MAAATDVVNLRNLSINGIGTGTVGIQYVSGGAIHVEDCNILGFATSAMDFQPAANAASLFVKHVNISNNVAGIVVGQLGQAVIAKSFVFNSGIALHLTQTARATVHDSVFAGNSAYGVWAEGTSVVNMDHGLIANNGVGVQGDSTVRLSEVMIGHNTTGLAGANVASFGNNRVAAGNTTNGAPTSTISQQ